MRECTFEYVHEDISITFGLTFAFDGKVDDTDTLIIPDFIEAYATNNPSLLIFKNQGFVDAIKDTFGDNDGGHQIELFDNNVPELQELHQMLPFLRVDYDLGGECHCKQYQILELGYVIAFIEAL